MSKSEDIKYVYLVTKFNKQTVRYNLYPIAIPTYKIQQYNKIKYIILNNNYYINSDSGKLGTHPSRQFVVLYVIVGYNLVYGQKINIHNFDNELNNILKLINIDKVHTSINESIILNTISDIQGITHPSLADKDVKYLQYIKQKEERVKYQQQITNDNVLVSAHHLFNQFKTGRVSAVKCVEFLQDVVGVNVTTDRRVVLWIKQGINDIILDPKDYTKVIKYTSDRRCRIKLRKIQEFVDTIYQEFEKYQIK